MFKFKNIFLSVLLFSFIASINSFSETIDVKDIHEQTVKNVDRHFYQGQVLNGTYDVMVNCNKYLPFFSKKSACLLKIDLLTSTQVFS